MPGRRPDSKWQLFGRGTGGGLGQSRQPVLPVNRHPLRRLELPARRRTHLRQYYVCPPVSTFDSPSTTVFATSAPSSSSREQASSSQAKTSFQTQRTSAENAAPPPVPTVDSAPTTMSATSIPSQDGSRRLNCLMEGESIIFLVTMGRDCVVSELKERIQGKRAMSTLKNIDPNLLELWKVSAINESRCEVTSLTPTIGRH